MEDSRLSLVQRLSALNRRLPARFQVFAQSVFFLVLAAAGLCVIVALKTFNFSAQLALLWACILAGPFSALWVLPEQTDWPLIGAVNLVMLFAHPSWPNRITRILTFLAFGSWLFWGVAISFSGV